MSNGTVDTRTVEMRFNNKNFESNVKQSMSTLDKLKQKLKLDGATKGLKEVEKSSKKLDFKDTDRSVNNLGKSFSALESIATGVFLRIGMKAADAGAKIIKSFSVDQINAGWSKLEEKTTAIQTIMSNLQDDTSKFVDEASKMEYVTKWMEQLSWFSDETSFNLPAMTDGIGKFVSKNIDLETSVTAIEGISLWAATAGQNASTAARMYTQLSQAIGRGYMMVQDWQSVESAQMDIAGFEKLVIEIAQKKGIIKEGQVTLENFRNSLMAKDTKGWLTKDVLLEAWVEYGSAIDDVRKKQEEYYEEFGREITASRAMDILEIDRPDLAETLGFQALRRGQEAKTLTEALTATSDAVSSQWMNVFENITGDYIQQRKLWTNLSNDLWDIFAGPISELNEIMSVWNQGFFKNGPKGILEKAFDRGTLEDIESSFSYVTNEAAQQAVELDSSVYSIEQMEDGTKRLIKRIKNADGSISKFYKHIFDPDLLSGREMLIGGFKNIMQAFFTGYTIEENGEVKEVLSVLQTIRKAFHEAFFPGEDADSLAKKLWDLTKKFQEFTERIKPSQDTLDKIKNSFKGFFTIFKIGAEFIKAIFEPFKNIFKTLFGGDVSKGVLNLTNDFSTWIQKLEKFLGTSKTFEKISQGITDGLDTISKALTGLSLNDLLTKIRTDVTNFFKNFDFQKMFGTISGWLSKIDFKGIFLTVINVFRSVIEFVQRAITEISQLNTDQLPEKLTPIQNFWLGLTEIFKAIKSVIPIVIGGFGKLIGAIGNAIGSLSKSDQLPEKLTPIQNFWLGIKEILKGIKSVLVILSGPFRKVATFIGEFLSRVAQTVTKGNNTSSHISRGIKRVKKVSKEGSDFIETLKSNSFVQGIIDFLKGLVYLLDSIGPILGKIGTFFGIIFTAIGNVIRYFTKNTEAKQIGRIVIGLLVILGVFITVRIIIWRIKKYIEWVKDGIEAMRDLIVGIGDTLDRSSMARVLRSITGLVIAIGLSLSLMASAVKKIGMGQFIAVAGILAAFIAIPLAITYYSDKLFKKVNLDELAQEIRIISYFMLAVAGSLILLSIAFNKMSSVDTSKIGWISLIFGVYITAVSSIGVGIAKLLKNVPSRNAISSLASISGFMVVLAISLNVVAKAFAKFAKIKFDKEKGVSFREALTVFATFIVGLGVMATIISALSKKLFKGSEAIKGLVSFSGLMVIAAIAMNVVAKAFAKFAKIKFENTDLWSTAGIFGLFMAISGGLAIAGGYLLRNAKAIAGVALMAGFMVTAAVSLGIVALAFSQISKDISPSQIAAALTIMLTFAAIVAVLAAVGAVLAHTGIGAGGMALVALIITAIGFACLAAGAAISMFVNSITKLIDTIMYLAEAVKKDGQSFIDALGILFDEALVKIGESKESMKHAFVAIALAIAEAIIEAAPTISEALVILLIYVMKNVSDTINASTDMLAYTIVSFIIKLITSVANNIRLYAPELVEAMRQTMEALLEVAILGLASIVEPFGLTGKEIAKKIVGWIPKVRAAMETIDEEGDSVLRQVAEDNIKLAESGKMAGNSLTDLTGMFSGLFSSFDGEEGGFLANLLGGFGLDGVSSFFDNLALSSEEGMQNVSNAVKNESPGMQTALKNAFDSGRLDDLDSGFKYVSRSAAEAAAESDRYTYKMVTLADGTEKLYKRIQLADGSFKYFSKTIYDSESDLDSMTGLLQNFGSATNVDTSSVTDGVESITQSFTDLTASAPESGSDFVEGFISGVRSKFDSARETATDLANIWHDILGFSEPEKGPLSDFHTYAPDMIRLWCSGIRNNFGLIDSSSESLTERIQEGFTTALDYVSSLINGGMSDELTIRPILDLSEIQNGTSLLSSMLSGGATYPLYGTANLTSSAAYGMRSMKQDSSSAGQTITNTGDIYNTFNISNNNPDAVAEKVSRIINQQIKRKQAIWAQ